MRILSSFSLLLACIFSISCSNPTDPSQHDLIERILAEIPISLPLQTPENESDPDYLLVAGKCDSILTLRRNSLQSRIQPFLEENIGLLEKRDSSYYWVMEQFDGNCMLMITPGDTLYFKIEWGLPLEPILHGSYYHEGYVIPATGQGRLSACNGNYSWGWGPTDYGFRLSVLEESGDWSGSSTVLVDSTAGGGFIEEYLGIGIRFSGKWDELGHGSWWNVAEQTGEW